MNVQPYIGMKLYGYCSGMFGRDSYGPNTIEAVSRDWIVVRDEQGIALFAWFSPESLEHETVIQFIEANNKEMI